eukprot:CAMPEP_0113941352 /NCGR_PEP_ID=MMETSP1339-20121228/7287_1 /TAXON_ID=94617 /ORGANISM="Fibrocapsa japonica" /LENGTH=302 /DNA_ID=CAMNT_0000945469 /DNA_START=155 /DNA_END=1063 /DNA_ORIENTATION=+ /assembly_acc=CAM_ASM_000762
MSSSTRRSAAPKRFAPVAPPDDVNQGNPYEPRPEPQKPVDDKARARFKNLVDTLVRVESEEELIPAVLTDIDLLVNYNATTMMDEMADEVREGKVSLWDLEEGEDAQEDRAFQEETLENMFGFMVDYTEAFVAATLEIQNDYQGKLRNVFEAAKKGDEKLDEVIDEIADSFDLQWIQFIDHEAERLASLGYAEGGENGPSEENLRLVGILNLVRTRIRTEVEKRMGPEVSVIMRLLQYDDREYRSLCLRDYIDVHKENRGEVKDRCMKLMSGVLEDMKEKKTYGDGMMVRLEHLLHDCKRMD